VSDSALNAPTFLVKQQKQGQSATDTANTSQGKNKDKKDFYWLGLCIFCKKPSSGFSILGFEDVIYKSLNGTKKRKKREKKSFQSFSTIFPAILWQDFYK
jgi:hypothetical protein